MKKIVLLWLCTLVFGCRSVAPSVRVLKGHYQGEGLYIVGRSLTATNSPNDFAMSLTICNGYSTPIFILAEECHIFRNTSVRVVCYGRNGEVLTRGETGRGIVSGSRSHPEDYVRISEGIVQDSKLVWSCCTTTGFTYHHPLDFENFMPDDGILMINDEDVLDRTYKMDVTVPVHIEYFRAGDERLYSCDTNVMVTISQKEVSSQPDN